MMCDSKLWISFHHQDDNVDHWALYLEAENDSECDIWQASGQTFEFEPTHIRGLRPEAVPNFKEKWLIKDRMTNMQSQMVREVANVHPVDNDAAYWDCRVFCFEILASLEMQNVLSRSSEDYRQFRSRLHIKWRYDDDSPGEESDDEVDKQDADNEIVDMTLVDASDLEGESSSEDEATTDTNKAGGSTSDS